MESRKTISKKPSVLEEENKSKEEINLTLQDRIDNTDWCKCGYECKLITIFTKSFCLLLRLKSRSARRVSRHSAFMGNCPTISHTC